MELVIRAHHIAAETHAPDRSPAYGRLACRALWCGANR